MATTGKSGADIVRRRNSVFRAQGRLEPGGGLSEKLCSQRGSQPLLENWHQSSKKICKENAFSSCPFHLLQASSVGQTRQKIDLKIGRFPGLSGGAWCNHKGPQKMEQGGIRIQEGDVTLEAEVGITGWLALKMEERTTSKEKQALSRSWKWQGNGLSPWAFRRNPGLLTPWL